MSEKFRIGILGIGGVGGYFGGKLAAQYKNSKRIEVVFISRGGNAEAISKSGLKIITPENEKVVYPQLVSDNPSTIGRLNLLIICTKAYDLVESIKKYRDCISSETTVLPLLNGVNHVETIKQVLPNASVWNGCAFIVARLIESGVVKVNSEIRLLQFGGKDDQGRLERVAEILNSAGIQAELSDDIEKTIWEKYIFISSLATLTSYLDKNIGEILSSRDNLKILTDLIQEVTNLARAKNINVASDIEKMTLSRIQSAPPSSTSSMHSDFMKRGKTELESLTGYVVKESQILNSPTPVYQELYGKLLGKSSMLT